MKIYFIAASNELSVNLDASVLSNMSGIEELNKTITHEVKLTTLDGVTRDASIFYDDEYDQFVLVTNETLVIGIGSCLELTNGCQEETEEEEGSDICPTEELVDINDDTLIAVLDENGCPTQTLSISRLMSYVSDNIENGCLAEGSQESLSSGDSILVIDDECNIKKVSQSELCCG